MAAALRVATTSSGGSLKSVSLARTDSNTLRAAGREAGCEQARSARRQSVAMQLPAQVSCLGHSSLHKPWQAAARPPSWSSLLCNDSVTPPHLCMQPVLQHSHRHCCPPGPGRQVLLAAGCWWQMPPCPCTAPSAALGQLATGGPPAAQAAPANPTGSRSGSTSRPKCSTQGSAMAPSICRPNSRTWQGK